MNYTSKTNLSGWNGCFSLQMAESHISITASYGMEMVDDSFESEDPEFLLVLLINYL